MQYQQTPKTQYVVNIFQNFEGVSDMLNHINENNGVVHVHKSWNLFC